MFLTSIITLIQKVSIDHCVVAGSSAASHQCVRTLQVFLPVVDLKDGESCILRELFFLFF